MQPVNLFFIDTKHNTTLATRSPIVVSFFIHFLILIFEQALPEEYVGCILRQVANSLLELHNFGFIHRDVKPANIFLTADGSAKVVLVVVVIIVVVVLMHWPSWGI